MAHSLALLSGAAHALTSIFALGLAWFAIAQSERPANAHKNFGYHRVGILDLFSDDSTYVSPSPSLALQGILGDGCFYFHEWDIDVLLTFTSFRKRAPGVASLMTLAGITSLGLMTVVNFLLGSDFVWFLAAVVVLWRLALVLSGWRK